MPVTQLRKSSGKRVRGISDTHCTGTDCQHNFVEGIVRGHRMGTDVPSVFDTNALRLLNKLICEAGAQRGSQDPA